MSLSLEGRIRRLEGKKPKAIAYTTKYLTWETNVLEAQMLGKRVQGPEPAKPKDYDAWVNARFKELNLPTV